MPDKQINPPFSKISTGVILIVLHVMSESFLIIGIKLHAVNFIRNAAYNDNFG